MRATSKLILITVTVVLTLAGCDRGPDGTDTTVTEPETYEPMSTRDATGQVKARFDGVDRLKLTLNEPPGDVSNLACGSRHGTTSFRVPEGRNLDVKLPDHVIPPDWCGVYWLAAGGRLDGAFVRFHGPDVTPAQPGGVEAENAEARILLRGRKAMIELKAGPGEFLRDVWSGMEIEVTCEFGDETGGFTRGTVEWAPGSDRQQVQLGMDVTGIVTACVVEDRTGDALNRTVVSFTDNPVEGAEETGS